MSTLSEEDDRKLREKIKPLMRLSGKRIVDLEKELKISSGGISGWLNGGIMRLSTKRKNEISLYLGLKNGILDDKFIHIFKSEKKIIEENISIFFDISEAKIYLLKSSGRIVGIYITQNGIQAIIIPKLSFEDITSLYRFKYCGDATIADNDFFMINSIHKIRTGSVNIFTNEQNKNSSSKKELSSNIQELSEWFSLISDLINIGITPKEVRIKLEIK